VGDGAAVGVTDVGLGRAVGPGEEVGSGLEVGNGDCVGPGDTVGPGDVVGSGVAVLVPIGVFAAGGEVGDTDGVGVDGRLEGNSRELSINAPCSSQIGCCSCIRRVNRFTLVRSFRCARSDRVLFIARTAARRCSASETKGNSSATVPGTHRPLTKPQVTSPSDVTKNSRAAGRWGSSPTAVTGAATKTIETRVSNL
jgi:hypothetical protein